LMQGGRAQEESAARLGCSSWEPVGHSGHIAETCESEATAHWWSIGPGRAESSDARRRSCTRQATAPSEMVCTGSKTILPRWDPRGSAPPGSPTACSFDAPSGTSSRGHGPGTQGRHSTINLRFPIISRARPHPRLVRLHRLCIRPLPFRRALQDLTAQRNTPSRARGTALLLDRVQDRSDASAV
jgi:hypothetical protein